MENFSLLYRTKLHLCANVWIFSERYMGRDGGECFYNNVMLVVFAHLPFVFCRVEKYFLIAVVYVFVFSSYIYRSNKFALCDVLMYPSCY